MELSILRCCYVFDSHCHCKPDHDHDQRYIDRSIERSIDHSIYRSSVQSFNRSIDLTIYRFIDLWLDRFLDLSICRSIVQSILPSTDLSIYRSINLSIYESINLSIKSQDGAERSYIEDCCTLQTHASGALGFSFACGRRPHVKLNPRTPLAFVCKIKQSSMYDRSVLGFDR